MLPRRPYARLEKKSSANARVARAPQKQERTGSHRFESEIT
jgi:hypothetical protein